MSRVLNLKLEQDAVLDRCQTADVGVSAIEELPGGGVRLVCMSSDGAEVMRKKLKSHLIQGQVKRERHRPLTPFWS